MASILKVNTIQDATNSNTAISVDTAGRVTTPARPAFRVCPAGDKAIADATTTLIQFDTKSDTNKYVEHISYS